MHRRSWSILALLMLWSNRGLAYPQFIAKGYTNCATCHYSPSGGGLPNSYGHASLSATFPEEIPVDFLGSLRATLAKNDVTGINDDGKSALQWDLGLDARLLFLPVPREARGGQELALIPMLIETGGALAYGHVLAYATVTPRRVGVGRTPNTVFSREHWLQYRVSDSWSARAGRMVLPFGLRNPDHTQYAREELGFDKWSQAYAIELDRYTESWFVAAALSFGDPMLAPSERMEIAAVGTVAYNFPSRASVGVSFLAGASGASARGAGSLFARLRLVQRSYVMGEIAAQRRMEPPAGRVTGTQSSSSSVASSYTHPRQDDGVGYLRLGWLALESLDLYFEWGGRAVRDRYNLTKLRYGWGINWQALPWIEVAPQVLLEEDVETGLKMTVMGQLHVFY